MIWHAMPHFSKETCSRLRQRLSCARPGLLAAVLAVIVGILTTSPLLADAITDYNLAVQFYKQRQFDRAAEACADFLKNHPNDELVRNARLYWGQALVQLKKFGEARVQFREFMAFKGDHPDLALAAYRVGECSYFLADYTASRDDFTSYLKSYPSHTLAEWAWIYLADSHARLKAYPQAIAVYDAYLNRFPQGQLKDEAQFGIGKAWEASGDRAKAQQYFEALADSPTSQRAADAQFQLAATYYDGTSYAQAAEAFELVLTRYPTHRYAGLAALNAGFARFHLNEMDKAISLFEQAAKVPGQELSARYWTGICYKNKKDFPKAIEVLSKAYESAPDQPLSEYLLFHWADGELRQGDFPKAQELFLKVQQTWPQGDQADDALFSATDAAYLARDYSTALELSNRFTTVYPNSQLKLAAEILKARILLAQGDWIVSAGGDNAEAKALFTQCEQLLQGVLKVSTDPQNLAFSRLQLARTYERLGEPEKAVQASQRLMANPDGSTPENLADAQLIQANALLLLKKYDQAATGFSNLLAESVKDTDPAGPMAIAGLAVSRAETGQWNEIPGLMDRLKAADPADRRFSSAACRIAELAYTSKDYTLAGDLFEQVVSEFPMGDYYVVALSGLAHTKYDAQDFRAAALAFGTLAEEARNDPVLRSHALNMQGLSLDQSDKQEEALAAFETGAKEFALQVTPDMPPTEKQLEAAFNAYQCARGGARAAGELGQYAVADRLYEAAYQELKKQPADKQGQIDRLIFEWANLSYNMEKYARSDEIFRILLQERDTGELADMARMALGESAFQEMKYAEARELFLQLANNPSTTAFARERALTQLLDIDWHEKKWADVLQWSGMLTSTYPESSSVDYAYFRAGEAHLNLGETPQAITSLNEVRQKLLKVGVTRPNWWPDVWILLAGAYLLEKDYARLDEVAEELRSQTAGTDEARLLYKMDLLQGRSLSNRAEFVKAREAFNRVLASESGRGTASAAEAQFRIAETYLIEKDFNTAQKEYMKVVVIGFEIPEFQAPALFQAAQCDGQLKRWKDAQSTYQELIQKFPESKEATSATQELEKLKPLLQPPM